jgi:hypothetical protein
MPDVVARPSIPIERRFLKTFLPGVENGSAAVQEAAVGFQNLMQKA